MLLSIHNLPNNVTYADVKSLIHTKCGLIEVILDNLVSEGRAKRVTVGLADDEDAAILVRKINGLFLGGQQLYVEDKNQKKASEQPFRSTRVHEDLRNEDYQSFQHNARPGHYKLDVAAANLGFVDPKPMTPDQQLTNQDPMMMMMNYPMPMGGMYYMPTVPAQTNFMGFGSQAPPLPQLIPRQSEVRLQNDHFDLRQENMEQNVQTNRPRNWRADDDRRSGNKEGRSHKDRQHQSLSNQGQRSEGLGRHMSRWDDADSRNPRYQSRSPHNNWNVRSQKNSERFQNNYNPEQPDNGGREYDQQQFGFSSNYSDPPAKLGKQNIYGNHVTESTPSGFPSDRNQPRNSRDQWNEPSFFQSRHVASERPKDNPNSRGEKYQLRRHESKFFQENGVFTPSQPKNWRVEPKVPLKRVFSKWEAEEPQPKRFAPIKTAVRKDLPEDKKWRAPNPQQRPKNVPRNSATTKPSKQKDWKKEPTNNPPKGSESKGADLVLQLQKDSTWRGQATSEIAKEMLKNLKININQKDEIFSHLKHSIKSRINVLLGDKLSVRTPDIIEKYRQKFPQAEDKAFFVAVLQNHIKGGGGSNGTDAKKSGKLAEILDSMEDKADKPKGADEKVASTKNPDFLPKFVKDKKASQQEIKLHKMELEEDVYTLPEAQQKALDEEADTLCDLFMGECMNPDDDEEKIVCELITDAAADVFRKVTRLQITKRLLKVHNNLALRVFCHGKRPQRGELETFLKKHGVISIRKSERANAKMYIACCDTYEHYDALCALKSVQMDNSTLLFKPIHLVGPPQKIPRTRTLELRKKFIESQIDRSKENLLEKPSDGEEKVTPKAMAKQDSDDSEKILTGKTDDSEKLASVIGKTDDSKKIVSVTETTDINLKTEKDNGNSENVDVKLEIANNKSEKINNNTENVDRSTKEANDKSIKDVEANKINSKNIDECENNNDANLDSLKTETAVAIAIEDGNDDFQENCEILGDDVDIPEIDNIDEEDLEDY